MDSAAPVIRQLLIRVAQSLRTDGFYCSRLGLNIKWVQDLGQHFDECRFEETRDTQLLLNSLMGLRVHNTPYRYLIKRDRHLQEFIPGGSRDDFVMRGWKSPPKP